MAAQPRQTVTAIDTAALTNPHNQKVLRAGTSPVNRKQMFKAMTIEQVDEDAESYRLSTPLGDQDAG